MKSIYHISLLILALLIVACGKDKNISTENNSLAVKVTVQKVNENNTNPKLSLSGKIQAKNSANLSTRLMGFVNKLHVNAGDSVKKGELLVSLNSSDLQAKAAQVNAGITEATAGFKNAEKDYKRFQNLFDDNSASQKELDDMTARYEMAKARLEAAKQMKNEINAQFEYTNIRAPFSGVVTNTFIDEGDMASPGMPLVEVENPNIFEVKTMVPETEIVNIKSDSEVDVLISSVNKTYKGKVSEVSTSAKNTGGQYLVTVDLENLDSNVFSGMFASVQFPTDTPSNTVLIPKKALVKNGQLSGVYAVSQSNTAVLRWLRLGRTYGDQVEVLSGLSTGETYIVSADGKLFNGVKIQLK